MNHFLFYLILEGFLEEGGDPEQLGEGNWTGRCTEAITLPGGRHCCDQLQQRNLALSRQQGLVPLRAEQPGW